MRLRGVCGVVALLLAGGAAPGCKRREVAPPPAAEARAEVGGPQPELVVQAGSHHYVGDARFSPDGRLLAVTSVDGLLKVHDLRAGKEWRTYTGASGPLIVCSWSPDGRRIAAAGFDKTVHIWDVASGAEVATLPGHSWWIRSLEFSPDGRSIASAAGLQDLVVAVWDVEGQRIRHALQHGAEVTGLAWSADSKTLVTAATREVVVWNAESGGRLGEIAVAPTGDGGRPLRFSPDGKLLAIDGAGDTVHVYDAGTWSEAAKRPGGSLIGWDGSDGSLVMYVGGEAVRFEARTGRRIGGFRAGGLAPAQASRPGGLQKAELDGRGRLVAVTQAMEVTLLDAGTGAPVRTIESTFWRQVGGAFGNGTPLLHVAWSPNAPIMATAGFDGVLRVIDLRRGAAPRQVVAAPKLTMTAAEAADSEAMLGFRPANVANIDAVEFTRDGAQVLTRDGAGLAVWDVRTLLPVRRFEAPGITAHSFAADGRTLAVASGDAVITVFDAATGQVLRKSAGGGLDADCQRGRTRTMATMATISGLGWSSDASKIYATYQDTATFAELDAQSFKPGKGGCAHNNRLNTIAWSDARDKLAVGAGQHMIVQTNDERGDGDNAVHVFGLTGDMPRLHRFEGHRLQVLAADFSPDGGLLATASADRTARLWDLRTGAPAATLTGHGGEVDSLAFSHDGKYLATASYDLTVKIWDVASRAEVATLVTLGTDGYVLQTTDHYYTASRQGFDSVAFRLGDTVVPVELFDLRLNRPDLVLARLGYAPAELIELYRKAHAKRLRKMKLDEAALRPDYHLPTAEFVDEPPVSTPQRQLTLKVRAQDSRERLDRLLVYVNDVPIRGSRGIDLLRDNTQRVEQTLDVELTAGRNKIQVAVMNAAGTESLQDTVEVISTAPEIKPNLYVVAVGVSKYADVRLNLKYAAKDAHDIGALFSGKGGRYGKVELLEIVDGEARRETILAARDRLQGSKVGDQVVVFVAGHGMLDESLDYYFVTHDFDREQPARRGLSYEQLESLLDGIPARRKLMMMDTCHSGEVEEDAVRVAPPLPGTTAPVRDVKVAADFRSFSYAGEVQSPDRSGELLAQLFADLRRGSGAAVISSASGAEFALESARWQNGVFTYSVLQGLGSGAADLDQDGTIRVSELRDYVVGEVHRLTQGKQTPTSRRENLDFDFPVL